MRKCYSTHRKCGREHDYTTALRQPGYPFSTSPEESEIYMHELCTTNESRGRRKC